MTLEIIGEDGTVVFTVSSLDIKVERNLISGRLGKGSFRLYSDAPVEVALNDDGAGARIDTPWGELHLTKEQVLELQLPSASCPLGICKR